MPESKEKIVQIMCWKRLPNGDYVANGKAGDFLIWRKGRIWYSRYRSIDKKYTFFLPQCRHVKESKVLCENNFYWE